MEREEFNAFLAGVVNFLGACRHFGFTAAVNDGGRLGSQTQGCAHGVHGRVATANNDNVLAVGNGRIGGCIGSIHQVGARQVFVAGHHARMILAGDAHEVGQACARGNEYAGIAFCFQFVNGDGFPNDAVFDEGDTCGFERVNLVVHNRIGQAKLGNAVFQHTANLV